MQRNQLNDALAELSDETSALFANTNRIFDNIQRYFHYIYDNPLSKFMSTTETFNGKTYQEYEREFMMYYKMIQKAQNV